MNKTLQDQYNLIKEGKGNKFNFINQVRRMFPNFITPSTSYNDAVTILKQKQIITEMSSEVKPQEQIDWIKVFEEKTKSPLDNQYDYKDNKSFNNEDFQQFLKGYYAEIKDPANDDKTSDQIKDIVLKNLAKDPMFYTKDGVFGIKGIGYKQEEIKAPTGKYKGSGYGDINK